MYIPSVKVCHMTMNLLLYYNHYFVYWLLMISTLQSELLAIAEKNTTKQICHIVQQLTMQQNCVCNIYVTM